MLTHKQGREQRRAIKRDIDRDLRAKAREKVLALRKRLVEARAHKRERMKELVLRYRSERLALRGRLKDMRTRVLHDLHETSRIERAAARDSARLRREDAKSKLGSTIEGARNDYLAERRYHMDLRRLERDNRERHRTARKQLSRAERRRESDDEVRQNIPAELIPLFDRVKGKVRASDRMSRTEAFLKYAEENPHDVFEIVEAKTEQMIRDLEAKHAEAHREMRGKTKSLAKVRLPPSAPRRRFTAEELAETPF